MIPTGGVALSGQRRRRRKRGSIGGNGAPAATTTTPKPADSPPRTNLLGAQQVVAANAADSLLPVHEGGPEKGDTFDSSVATVSLRVLDGDDQAPVLCPTSKAARLARCQEKESDPAPVVSNLFY